jgi:hypothetical protein
MKSAPSGCAPPGAASEARGLVRVGSNWVIQGANSAISTNITTITAPAAPSG